MRRVLAPVLALVGILAWATPAAALLLWTLTGAPLTATAGVATSFSLTATNLDLLTELGCLEVDLPASFDIVGASAGNASNGDEWEAVVFTNKVAVHSLSGGGRLELGQSITFTITAVPGEAGTFTWSNHAHRQQDCSGTEEVGVPLAIVVLPPLISTPAPTPTPSPTPTATPRPTPTPTPILPLELPTLPPVIPLPSLPALPTIRPATPIPTVLPSSPGASPTASPSATPSPIPDEGSAAVLPVGTTGTPPGAGGLDASGAAPVVLGLGDPEGGDGSVGEVSLGPLGVIDGIGVWAIPGAIVGGPGLLVILWVILQTGVALAWIPSVRRMRGKDGGGPGWPSGQVTA